MWAELEGPATILIQAIGVASHLRRTGQHLGWDALSHALNEIALKAQAADSDVLIQARIHRRNTPSQALFGRGRI